MYPFKPGNFAPRNGWYVAAFIHEIGEELVERWILNQPVVLYRKHDGEAVAVSGRCPHRHFPLGKSRRVGDAIECGYHGITFDARGKCTFVPSQTSIPGVYSIPAFPLVERGLWAWIWMGDPDKADEALIPTLEEIDFEVPGLIPHAFFAFEIDGRYQLLNDNLLDLSHLSYLHGTSIGTKTDAETPEVRDVNDRRLSSRRIMNNTEMTPILMELTDYRGPIDRVSGMDFFFPGFHSGIGDFRISEGQPGAGDYLSKGRVWHAVTPATRNKSHYFFAMTISDPQEIERTKAVIQKVLDEDILATVEIERIVGQLDEIPQELMLKSDTTAVMGRRILQAMMDAENADAV
ncbi:Rieske 2Fe-2S domain-containing protein [Novosphingobium profundi]|uniref:Rieske 2Fe-2S domain-containing protein n=1 Tax=Novosphingobium profundi TaxID=1774954 RepID=UPI001BD9C20F|nr:Rieske 2Fe-2S domain-containing protein [Novosphingobium profundi]MBT0670721.1 Rieske 2Fe-2S domain-containing protein [Novosphingobium profundi]